MVLVREAGVSAAVIKAVLADNEFRLILDRVRSKERQIQRSLPSEPALLLCPLEATERLARHGFGITDADIAAVEADVAFQAELAVARVRGALSRSGMSEVDELRRQVASWIPGLLELLAVPDTPQTPYLKRRAHHQEVLASCLVAIGAA